MELDHEWMVRELRTNVTLSENGLDLIILGDVRLFELFESVGYTMPASKVDLTVSTPTKGRLNLELLPCIVSHCVTSHIRV